MQPETLFPISLKLKGRRCLVVGAGPVADTKIEALHQAGAIIHRITDRLEPRHLDGITLAVDTGEAPHLTPLLRTLARDHGVLLNSVDQPDACDFYMPAVVKRGPVQVAISTGGAAPTLARTLRQMIERLLPAHLEAMVARAAAIRAEVKATFRPAEQRRFWNRMFDDILRPQPDLPPDRLTGAEIAATRHDATEGEVWLVGAGAGSADLITLKGLRVLERADVVLYDALIDPALLAHARRDARLIAVGKRCGRQSTPQDFINRLMASHARAGDCVVRLKCGDPFIFGRGGEELEHLQGAGIKVQMVPGVTAASVAAADCGIALTHRGISRRLTLMTATPGPDESPDKPDWQALTHGGTVVLYMARNKLRQAFTDMIAAGVPATLPVALVANAGRPDRRYSAGTLASFLDGPAPARDEAPTLILVGESARSLVLPAHGEAADRDNWLPNPETRAKIQGSRLAT
ncbi:MAG: uroporphyrinogen-III C-methyltransferase [Alphaproteobacteria bacterium]|nr:MAG: uroporphyrinogen-III C-methyltransferase [Alphaproteobacteria bacterium]